MQAISGSEWYKNEAELVMPTGDSLLPDILRKFFSSGKKLAVAYSGGLDSRFLCHVAKMAECDILAVHASGPHISPRDTEYALDWASACDLPILKFEINPLDCPQVAENSRDRCYGCKKKLFIAVKKLLLDTGEGDRIICDGSNADDHKLYRPGLKAVEEEGILSPLAMAKLGKNEIHALAALYGMANPDQKAKPCLLTRFSYGLQPDEQILSRLGRTEDILASRLGEEINFRLRLMPEPVLQLDRQIPDMQTALLNILIENGFINCRLEYRDKISGYFDLVNHIDK